MGVTVKTKCALKNKISKEQDYFAKEEGSCFACGEDRERS